VVADLEAEAEVNAELKEATYELKLTLEEVANGVEKSKTKSSSVYLTRPVLLVMGKTMRVTNTILGRMHQHLPVPLVADQVRF
jgi:hypothetical protein